MPLRNRNIRPPPTLPPSSMDNEPRAPEEGLDLGADQQDLTRGLATILAHLKGDPAVAYVLASLRKGLAAAGVEGLPPEEKERLIQEVKLALQRNPSVLRALQEYAG
jgi:hypothetical protein